MLCCGILRTLTFSAQFPVARFFSRTDEATIKLIVKPAETPGRIRLNSMVSRFSRTAKQYTDTPSSSVSLPVSLARAPPAPPRDQPKRHNPCTIERSSNARAFCSRRALSYGWFSLFHLILWTASLTQEAASDGACFFRSPCRFFPQLVKRENYVCVASSINRSVLHPLCKYTDSAADSIVHPPRQGGAPPLFSPGAARCLRSSSRKDKHAVKKSLRSEDHPPSNVTSKNNPSKSSCRFVKNGTLSFLLLHPTANVFRRRRSGEMLQSPVRPLMFRRPCVRTATSQAAVTDQQCGEHQAPQTMHSREEKQKKLYAKSPVSVPHGVLDQFPFIYGADAFVLARKPSCISTGVKTLTPQDDGKTSFIYFDNAATTQKPWSVLQELQRAYIDENANVHRSTYARAAAATERLESVRSQLAKYLNAEHSDEIVFTSGATDSINLVAGSWGEANISEKDEIVLSVAEHHSNIVPWQLLAARKHASLRFIELDKQLLLSVPSLLSSLSPRTKLVALSHTSNVLGSFNPYVREVIGIIKQFNPSIAVLLDASQALAHQKVDVRELRCDFLVGSGHKMYGPTGVGFLYGKRSLLLEMPPWKGGGEMIADVHRDWSTYADPPARFEAGTPPFVQVAGLGAALDFLEQAGLPELAAYESSLYTSLRAALEAYVPSLHLFCPPPFPCTPPQLADSACFRDTSEGAVSLPPVPLISFVHPTIHAQDLATFLDVCGGVCVRSGHHCCQLLHRETLQVQASCRASLAVYNTEEEVHRFAKSVQTVVRILEEKGCEALHATPGTDRALASEPILPQEETLPANGDIKRHSLPGDISI